MAAGLQSPDAVRRWLVRLVDLNFDDFLLLPTETLDLGHWTEDLTADWLLATSNALHVALRFQSSDCKPQTADCRLTEPPALAAVKSAQERLVTHFAYDLLRVKAPPLYDALPWHDWDFSVVAKRFRLWQTRFLLAGDGTTVTMCRCRKSAGVYVLEPCSTIAHYIERKAGIEKVRRFGLLSRKPQAASCKLLSEIPLPDNSVDLAIIGSSPELQTADRRLVTQELARVSRNLLLIENNPLVSQLPESPLAAAGFKPESVAVSGIGPRRCWWKQA